MAQAGSVTARSSGVLAGVVGDDRLVRAAAHDGGQVTEDDPQPGQAAGLLVPVAFDVGDRRGRVIVAVQDGGEHAQVVLRGPALVRFPVRVVGDDVGVVGSLAAAHHHVQRLSRRWCR